MRSTISKWPTVKLYVFIFLLLAHSTSHKIYDSFYFSSNLAVTLLLISVTCVGYFFFATIIYVSCCVSLILQAAQMQREEERISKFVNRKSGFFAPAPAANKYEI